MKKIIFSVTILTLIFISCKKDNLQQDDLLPIPVPIPVQITGKNVLLLEFDGTILINGSEWNIRDSTNFLPSNLSASDRKLIIDSVQRELQRNGANVLVTENDSDYYNAIGLKERFVITATSSSAVTTATAGGVAHLNALYLGMQVAGFIFTSSFSFYVDGISYNWPALARSILHEFGHTAGLLHVPATKQDWMYPSTKVTKNGFFGTNVVNEMNAVINEQQIISNSVPRRMVMEHRVIID